MLVKPIAVVHSPITTTKDMPSKGSPATVEVFPEYEDGLLGIEDNSHLVFVAWIHKANRRALRLDRVGPENLPLHKGVFSLRSPSRPNPLGISTGKLLKVEGRKLFLDRLDFIDGTQIIDIKGYSLGWDAIFSSRSIWDTMPANQRDAQVMIEMLRAQAVNFHGCSCPSLLLGVKMVYDAAVRWEIGPRDPALKFELGDDGCIADAVQGTTGATFGNGRLHLKGELSYTAVLEDKVLRYIPKDIGTLDGEDLLNSDAAILFDITEATTPAGFGNQLRRCECRG